MSYKEEPTTKYSPPTPDPKSDTQQKDVGPVSCPENCPLVTDLHEQTEPKNRKNECIPWKDLDHDKLKKIPNKKELKNL